MGTVGQEFVSVIVPLLNEEENVGPLYERLKNTLGTLRYRSEIIFVDDGSTDSTLATLQGLTRDDETCTVVHLPVNLGQHRAILEGFSRSAGSTIVTLDGDLQNPPEEIPELVSELSKGYEVVAGWRRRRRDSSARILVSSFLNLFASVATGVRMHDYGCMLRGYRRDVLVRISRYGKHTPFIPTLVTSMGARTTEIVIRHDPRERGSSKYGLTGLTALYRNLLLDFLDIKLGFSSTARPMAAGRIAFFGYGLVGHACLKYLLDAGFDVACVVTHADDPEEEIWFPSVSDLAREWGIPTLAPDNLSEPSVIKALRGSQPDLILSVFFRQILPREFLSIPRVAAVNLHPSMLPEYRGRASLNWAMLRGETSTGVTLHHMSEKPDRGDIIGQQAIKIEDADTIGSIYEKAVEVSRDMLRRLLPAILSNGAPRLPQDEKKASYFGRRTADDGLIEWSKTAQETHNLVRAVTHPFPGAFTFLKGKKLWIWEASHSDSEGLPGTIISSGNGAFAVGTGRGALLVKRAQVEGECETSGAEALRKLGAVPGDRFDD